MNYSQDPEIEAASSLVVAALKEFYEQGDSCIKKSCRRKGDLMESERPEQAVPLVV